MNRSRLLLADDHTLVLEGFRRLLESDYELVGMVTDGRALLAEAQRLTPDVILLDISMPGLNGVDAARQLRQAVPQAKIVFVTMHADRTYVTEAFRAGASGYLLKQAATSELSFAIREVLKDHHYVTPLVADAMVQPALDGGQVPQTTTRAMPSAYRLTPRQREVLQLVAEGHSLKAIADRLRVSVKTVEYHKAKITTRLKLRNTAEFTKCAISEGLVSI